MPNYTELFQRKLKRNPTKEDLGKIGERLLTLSNARDLPTVKDQDPLENSFRAMTEAYRTNDTDLEGVLSTLAQEEEEKGKVRVKRRRSMISIGKKTALGLFAASLLGTFTGIGLAVYNSFQEPAVQIAVQHYRTKEKEAEDGYAARKAQLENKFFGPLDTLTSISTKTTLTPAEQQADLKIYLYVDVGKTDNIIYDRKINGVTIVARHVIKEGFLEDKHSLMIAQYDTKGNVAAAYEFSAGADKQNFRKLLKEDEDIFGYSKTILFNGKTRTIVDYEREKIMQFENNSPLYIAQHKEAMEIYNSQAAKILTEFRALLQRGPNVE